MHYDNTAAEVRRGNNREGRSKNNGSAKLRITRKGLGNTWFGWASWI
jgi:hypothetical protein